ncbi:hypothetical protein [Microcystis aeruginosa]|nr:hypothetical protein [Microcystis aeruginosa]
MRQFPHFPTSPLPHFPTSPLPHFPTSPLPHFPTSPHPSPFSTIITRNQKYLGFLSYFVLFVKKTFFLQ